MDREIVYAIIFAVAGMAIVGNVMLGPKSPEPSQSHTYAPQDIRHGLQQVEAKKKRKHHAQKPAPEALAPAGSTSSGGGNAGASDEPQEEPSLSDDSYAEEPPLE